MTIAAPWLSMRWLVLIISSTYLGFKCDHNITTICCLHLLWSDLILVVLPLAVILCHGLRQLQFAVLPATKGHCSFDRRSYMIIIAPSSWLNCVLAGTTEFTPKNGLSLRDCLVLCLWCNCEVFLLHWSNNNNAHGDNTGTLLGQQYHWYDNGGKPGCPGVPIASISDPAGPCPDLSCSCVSSHWSGPGVGGWPWYWNHNDFCYFLSTLQIKNELYTT